MPELSWDEVQDRPQQRLEFGACHIREAWRRHKTPQQKFLGLKRAFQTSDHRIPKLLQEVNGNPNAQSHSERGQALYAAVWFHDTRWAVLCNSTHATLVRRDVLETIPTQKIRNDAVADRLEEIFQSSPDHLKMKLNSAFYDHVLLPVQRSVD